METLGLARLGAVPYGQALALQHRLRDRLAERRGADPSGWVLTLEHPPTVTLGKRGKPEHLSNPQWLADRGVEIFRIDRGGEATYHGPGQLVVYPIVDLDRLGLGVVDLIRGVAGCLSEAMAEYGIAASYDLDHPGVWTDTSDLDPVRRKVASVGMRVQRGVTTHGAAINLMNDMTPFTMIVPCGMPNAPMARLADLADGHEVTVDDFADRFLAHLGRFLERGFEPAQIALPEPGDWAAPLEPGALGD